MAQWLVFALMTTAAIFLVLWPLSRGRGDWQSGTDVAVYEDQLRELARDRQAGLIGDAEAEAARVEVSRRLLAAADAAATTRASEPAAAAQRRRRAVALIALIGLPAGASGLYFVVGSPNLPDQPLAARIEAPSENRSIAALVAQVESHLGRHPEDARGWEVVGPVYMQVGRFDDAVKARRNLLRLLGESAEREADLGEALVAVADGVVTIDAKAAFDRALALDARDPKARFFAALSAEQDGKADEAAAIWGDMLAKAPAGAPWAGLVRESLDRVGRPQLADRGGPNAQEVAAAGDLAPEQRTAMIVGMVERLATRLKDDGPDVEGWLKLVRSYVVLGDRDRARQAAADARHALAADPEKVRQLDELVKGLGL